MNNATGAFMSTGLLGPDYASAALVCNIPPFVEISHGRISDVGILGQLAWKAAFYVMDRGCVHFARLYQITLAAAFFVVRARSNPAIPAPILSRGRQEHGCAL
jgi:hypothetical protein